VADNKNIKTHNLGKQAQIKIKGLIIHQIIIHMFCQKARVN